MKVKVLGVSSEKKTGVGKKSNKSYSGWFVSYCYKSNGTNGFAVASFLYSENMCEENAGVVPQPGNICDLGITLGGYIETCEILDDKGDL